jgi:hypothetical protein
MKPSQPSFSPGKEGWPITFNTSYPKGGVHITMAQQRIRRKRRREFRKPDAVIVSLSSLTIILLLVWGGLSWKDYSERALTVHTNGEELAEQSMQDNGGLQMNDSEGLNTGVEDQPSTPSVTIIPEEQSQNKPGVSGEASHIPEAADPAQDKVAKPETQSPAESASNNATKSESPSPTETHSPSPSQSESTISQEQQYEQQFIQVQAMCTKDMKEVLNEAETSIQQLDKTDLYAVQAWNEKLTKEMATAESKCDGKFQEVAQNAENDSVSPVAIEEWKQTFSVLKKKLQEESQAKLQQLIGG